MSGVDGLLRNDKSSVSRGVNLGVDRLLRNDKGGDNLGGNNNDNPSVNPPPNRTS